MLSGVCKYSITKKKKKKKNIYNGYGKSLKLSQRKAKEIYICISLMNITMLGYMHLGLPLYNFPKLTLRYHEYTELVGN